MEHSPDVIAIDVADENDGADGVGDREDRGDVTDARRDVGTCWVTDDSSVDASGPIREAMHRTLEIAELARAYWLAHVDDAGVRRFPVTGALNPPVVPQGVCVRTVRGAWLGPPWEQLMFEIGPGEWYRYSYGFDSAGTDHESAFTARAVGDLDGDRVYSTFEWVGRYDGDGGIMILPGRAVRLDE